MQIDLVKVGYALSDPARLSIIELLKDPGSLQERCCSDVDGVCVCDIAEALGMSQPRVSYHLKVLRSAGLVSEYRKGKWAFYSVDLRTVSLLLVELKALFGLEEGVS